MPAAVPWQPPQSLFAKVNFDAVIFYSDSFQVAVVARDSGGSCISWSIKKFPGYPSPVVAGACAARFAILMAIAKGWTHIHLEGDSLQVVNAFNDRDEHGL